MPKICRRSQFSLGVFPAKTFLTPGNAPAWAKAHALVYGVSSGDLWGTYDPARSLWRTLRGCSLWGEVELLQTLPKWGMWDGGALFRLPMPVRRTFASAFSLWPTPSRTDNRVRALNPDKLLIRANGALRYINPRTTGSGSTTQIRLSQAVDYVERLQRWPTPMVGDAHARRASVRSRQLHGAGDTLTDALRKQEEPRPMNPEWEELLMGFPLGWTDLSDTRPTKISPSTPTNHPARSRRERRQIVQRVLKRSETR